MSTGGRLPALSFESILRNHETIAPVILAQVKPFAYFQKYLESGYYPYLMESSETYQMRLQETIVMILEMELPQLRKVETAYIPKLRQLLGIIAESSPFVPNISKLSERIGINRQTLITYLHYLQEAALTRNLFRNVSGISILQKPEKLYLENTNLMYAFMNKNVDTGNVRETFLANQLAEGHKIEYPETGDFLVDSQYLIEVGGKNKTGKQLQQTVVKSQNAFIAADTIEYGYGNKIPLWLFGFLY
jgi:predicted AAA+ superfamily ATPase